MIAPDGCSPGTTADIDFYFAPVTIFYRRVPPLKGWVKDDNGTGLPPKLSYRRSNKGSGEPGKGTLSCASRPFMSAAQAEASETQQRTASKQCEVFEQKEHSRSTTSEKGNEELTKQNELLIAQNKQLRADMDGLIQQRNENEKKSMAEINALRATIATYEHQERAQLKSRIKAMRGKAERYEQKEKKAKAALQEMVALEEKFMEVGIESTRKDEDSVLVHETTSSRNAKRARHDGSSTGSLERVDGCE